MGGGRNVDLSSVIHYASDCRLSHATPSALAAAGVPDAGVSLIHPGGCWCSPDTQPGIYLWCYSRWGVVTVPVHTLLCSYTYSTHGCFAVMVSIYTREGWGDVSFFIYKAEKRLPSHCARWRAIACPPKPLPIFHRKKSKGKKETSLRHLPPGEGETFLLPFIQGGGRVSLCCLPCQY